MFKITANTVTVRIEPFGRHGPRWIAENISHDDARMLREEFMSRMCDVAHAISEIDKDIGLHQVTDVAPDTRAKRRKITD